MNKSLSGMGGKPMRIYLCAADGCEKEFVVFTSSCKFPGPGKLSYKCPRCGNINDVGSCQLSQWDRSYGNPNAYQPILETTSLAYGHPDVWARMLNDATKRRGSALEVK